MAASVTGYPKRWNSVGSSVVVFTSGKSQGTASTKPNALTPLTAMASGADGRRNQIVRTAMPAQTMSANPAAHPGTGDQ